MEDDRLDRKVSRRVIPLMMVLYLFAFLDRVNIGFAALTMNKDLGFTPYIYGWGAGIFFLGYILFEVPSNVVLAKVGARLWICRIMVTWGVVSSAMAFVDGAWSFYILRFLLGVAEAGFLPGMIFYLTYWFPAPRRAKFVALFMAAVPLASAIGAPISGFILGIDGVLGLKGWQWLFILEGVPSCLLGVLVLILLPDGPAKAAWLTDGEKAEIAGRLARDRAQNPHKVHESLWPALRDYRVVALGLVYFGIVVGLYGIGLWLPQIIKAMGFTNAEVGLIVAVPYFASAAAMMLWGRHSDRTGERVWHVALPALVSAAGFLASIYLDSTVLQLCALGVACVGIYSALGPFWTLPSMFLGSMGAAAGIALINSVGNAGGFLGPYLVGWIKEATDSFHLGMAALALGMIGAAVLVLSLARALHLASARRNPA